MDATILIVEDEQNINDILAFTFSKEGYKTISAYDGIKGYEMAMNDNPDLILLDVMLPGMDGMEVCRKIRDKSDVPIIMLTAREDEVDKVLGLEFGADDYITKPYSVRELTARVKANLRRIAVKRDEIEPENKNIIGTSKVTVFTINFFLYFFFNIDKISLNQL